MLCGSVIHFLVLSFCICLGALYRLGWTDDGQLLTVSTNSGECAWSLAVSSTVGGWLVVLLHMYLDQGDDFVHTEQWMSIHSTHIHVYCRSGKFCCTSYFRGSVLVMQVINMWYVHTHVCIHLCIHTCTYTLYCLSTGGVFTYLAKLPMLGDACGTRLVYLTSLLEVNNTSVERHMDFLCNGRHCATSSPAFFTKMWCIN